jgi:hypothetical protein
MGGQSQFVPGVSIWQQYEEAAKQSTIAFQEMMRRFNDYGESHDDDMFVAPAVRRFRSLHRRTMQLLELYRTQSQYLEPSDLDGESEDDDATEAMESTEPAPVKPVQEGPNSKGSLRRISGNDPEFIEDRYRLGMSIEQIAISSRLTTYQVTTVLLLRGALNELQPNMVVSRRVLKYDDDFAKQVAQEYAESRDRAAIKKKFGLTEVQLKNVLRKASGKRRKKQA